MANELSRNQGGRKSDGIYWKEYTGSLDLLHAIIIVVAYGTTIPPNYYTMALLTGINCHFPCFEADKNLTISIVLNVPWKDLLRHVQETHIPTWPIKNGPQDCPRSYLKDCP